MKQVKTSVKTYWDWRSQNYGFDIDRYAETAFKWEEAVTELVDDGQGKTALDIGTGTGQLAIYLARSGFQTTGIDISGAMIYQARQKSNELGLNINFCIQDAENTRFPEDTFDVVVSRNILWTLPDPDKAVREWRRILKPGGKIIISDGFWRNHTWRHLHLLAIHALKSLFNSSAMIPVKFFTTYKDLQNKLPFYRGMKPKDINGLMSKASFRDIGFYDVKRFGRNPYGKKRPFFIAFADK